MSRFGLGLVALAAALLSAWARLDWIESFEVHHPQASRPVIDEAAYDTWARELAAGDWIGDEVFFQEPLYPYVLGAAYAAFGADLAVARRLNVALGALFAALMALLAARLVARPGPMRLAAAAIAGVGASLALPLVHGSALLLKPPLFLALLAGLTLALLATRERASLWRFTLVGALGALAALVRGNALLLLPVLVLWAPLRTLTRRERPAEGEWHGALATLAGVALVLTPVAVRNLAVGGVLAVTTSGAGTNLHIGNHPSNPWGVATELPFVRGIPDHEPGDWEREAERRVGRERREPVDLDRGEVSRYWLRATLISMADSPAEHAAIFARKLRLALHRGEVADNHDVTWDVERVQEAGGRAPWSIGGWLPWGALGIAGGLLALRRRAERDGVDVGPAREVAALLALYVGTLVLTVVVGRMRQPLFVFALPLASLAILQLAGAVARRAPRELALVAGLAALPVAAALAPARPAALEERDRDERDFNLAVQHLEHGELGESLEIARPLLERRPSPRVRALLAEALWSQGRALRAAGAETDARARFEAARDVLEDAARGGEPSGFRQFFYQSAVGGRIALALGDVADAEKRLGLALGFDPTDLGLELDLLRARSALAAEQGLDLQPARAAAAALAQDPGLPPALLTPARLLWAELEWRVGAGLAAEAGQERIVSALKILQGTLSGIDESDTGAVATRILAARIQLSLGNRGAAERLVAPVLERWPSHAGARAVLDG